MIKMIVSIAGTDANGESFSCASGELCAMTSDEEERYIDSGAAEAATEEEIAAHNKRIEEMETEADEARKVAAVDAKRKAEVEKAARAKAIKEENAEQKGRRVAREKYEAEVADIREANRKRKLKIKAEDDNARAERIKEDTKKKAVSVAAQKAVGTKKGKGEPK